MLGGITKGLGGLLGGKKKDPEKQAAKQLAQQLAGLTPEQQQAKLQELAQKNPNFAAKVEQQLAKLTGAGQSPTGGAAPQMGGLDPSSVQNAANSIVPQIPGFG